RYDTYRHSGDFYICHSNGMDAVLPLEEADQLLLGNEPEPREDRAELLGLTLLLGERLLELSLGDQPLGNQEVAEAPGLGLPKFVSHLHFLLYPTDPLQCVGKGTVRVVKVQDEKDAF